MRWEVTEEGKNCSDVGGIPLDNSTQCQLAAEALGNVYSGSAYWPDVPNGCILSVKDWNYNQVYWNIQTGPPVTHLRTAGDGSKAICKTVGKNYIDRYSINIYHQIVMGKAYALQRLSTFIFNV